MTSDEPQHSTDRQSTVGSAFASPACFFYQKEKMIGNNLEESLTGHKMLSVQQ